MCGIVGYIGPRQAAGLIIEGLRRLEYRGYDSSGIAIVNGSGLKIMKAAGKLTVLEQELKDKMPIGTLGIGHTRWATHGAPTTINAHPHTDQSGRIAVIHNGIIENSGAIRKALEQRGHTFKSETDTEVLAHLVGEFYQGNLEEAVAAALRDVDGAYGLALISSEEPDVLVAARNGSPLLVGVGENEYFVASDASAMLEHTRSVVYLDDGEMVVLTRDGYPGAQPRDGADRQAGQPDRVGPGHDRAQRLSALHAQGDLRAAGEPHQHGAGTPPGRGRQRPLQRSQPERRAAQADRADHHHRLRHLLALGAHRRVHAGGDGADSRRGRVRLRVPLPQPGGGSEDTLVIAVSQSGETADTLAAVREAKRRGARTIGLVNVVGSTIAREVDGGIYLHAGPEIGVASTKAFTSQVAALAMVALKMARLRNLSLLQGTQLIEALKALPAQIRKVLDRAPEVEKLADRFAKAKNALYLGRGVNFPVALEGALKLKEISYIHAEGYPAAEMKHGPIALIDENMPVVFIAPRDAVHDKIVSNIEEVKARGGKVIALINEGDTEIERLADATFAIPETLDLLTPILTSIPLQLLSYYVAVRRGCNVDQPRNLAKSVTVE